MDIDYGCHWAADDIPFGSFYLSFPQPMKKTCQPAQGRVSHRIPNPVVSKEEQGNCRRGNFLPGFPDRV